MTAQKRIVSIELDNFRAYHGKYSPIELPNGENLLIYGENGSGKSSLFKAINNYFTSSISNIPFSKNRYLQNSDGNIKLSFADFTAGAPTNAPLAYHFGATSKNNGQPFIKNAALIKGFLDYTSLLDIYFHKESNPNLFNLIVLVLLADHIPSSSGGNFKFKDKWEQLQKDLIENAYTRNDRCHRIAVGELPTYQVHLKGTLDRIFSELNRLLREYFNDLNLEIDFELARMQFNYGYNKADWFTPAELYLKIKRDGILIQDSYNDYLNEARLSAFAICLYLASLKVNPANIELKVLYLDDIFIGLDAANRIPILRIVDKEFQDYQIFLSTYDRHTYEFAKRTFLTSSAKWKSIELYVGIGQTGRQIFDKPIVLGEENDYQRAMFFLHHSGRPDFPAAANYFRKYAEGLLSTLLPPYEIREDDLSQIPEFQLTKLVNAGIKFLNKVGLSPTLLVQLKNALPTLLHPLSHFNLISPIYKKELVDIQNLLVQIEVFLLDAKNICTPILHAKHTLILNIVVNPALTLRYKIYPKEMIYIISETGQPKRYSLGACHCRQMCTVEPNGNEINGVNFPPTKPDLQYLSISDAYQQIFTFLQGTYNHLIQAPNYITQFNVHIDNVQHQLDNLLV